MTQLKCTVAMRCVLFAICRMEEELPQNQKAGTDWRTGRWSHHALAVEVTASSDFISLKSHTHGYL